VCLVVSINFQSFLTIIFRTYDLTHSGVVLFSLFFALLAKVSRFYMTLLTPTFESLNLTHYCIFNRDFLTIRRPRHKIVSSIVLCFFTKNNSWVSGVLTMF